jgi:DNA polymerase
MMDTLAALRLQIEWGADEALDAEPIDRLRPQQKHTPDVRSLPQAKPNPQSSVVAPGSPNERAARIAETATTLDELRTVIAGFDGSVLRGTATNMVFLEGDPACGLLLVGEAPNADADRAGSPFAGPVGAYLELMLRSVGLDRGSVCLAPLIPWRPPGDRPPSPAEIAMCLPFLHRMIALVAPRRIVALGPLPTRALLGATPIRRRASPVWQAAAVPGRTAAIPTLTMPSPTILLRIPTQRRSAWADLRLLRHSLADDLTQM